MLGFDRMFIRPTCNHVTESRGVYVAFVYNLIEVLNDK